MGVEFSACKSEMDRMNVTALMQSLYLWRELLSHSKNSKRFVEMFVFRLDPRAQSFVGQNQFFLVVVAFFVCLFVSKLK